MKAKHFVLPFVLLLSFSVVRAQKGQTRATVQYNAGLPVGSFKNTVSETSLRGFSATVLYGLNNKLSVGAGTGFQDFYQKNDRRLYKLSDGRDLSAVMTNSIQVLPLLATVRYAFTPGAAVQPYASLGVGGNFVTYSQLLGEFGDKQAVVRLAARPEAGVYVPFRKDGQSGFTLGASYNVMPLNRNGISNLNHVGVHAGISIPLRD